MTDSPYSDEAADRFLKTPTTSWSDVVFNRVPRTVVESIVADREGFAKGTGMIVSQRMANLSDADTVHEAYLKA